MASASAVSVVSGEIEHHSGDTALCLRRQVFGDAFVAGMKQCDLRQSMHALRGLGQRIRLHIEPEHAARYPNALRKPLRIVPIANRCIDHPRAGFERGLQHTVSKLGGAQHGLELPSHIGIVRQWCAIDEVLRQTVCEPWSEQRAF
jgi:hypothetical protein